jgi:hypothetical protein
MRGRRAHALSGVRTCVAPDRGLGEPVCKSEVLACVAGAGIADQARVLRVGHVGPERLQVLGVLLLALGPDVLLGHHDDQRVGVSQARLPFARVARVAVAQQA